MEITENIINNRYKNKIFENSLDELSNIKILHNIILSTECPFFSIVTPICNQENIIVKNIKSILENTSEKKFELILIIDCCSDNTELNITNFLQTK